MTFVWASDVITTIDIVADDCTAPNQGSFSWYVPARRTSFQLEVAGGGDAQPDFTGRGGKGAV